jgi:hypothetical protein
MRPKGIRTRSDAGTGSATRTPDQKPDHPSPAGRVRDQIPRGPRPSSQESDMAAANQQIRIAGDDDLQLTLPGTLWPAGMVR